MKIVCDNCSAKYSIADEKVAGKVFKIRCKKCTNVIVVRGDQLGAEEQEAAAPAQGFDYGGDAVWHVVIDGDQQGPYSPAQIGQLLSDGTIDWEAYVWREGFDGWKPARDVPELVAAVTGDASHASGGVDPHAATGDPMGADPFAAAGDAFGGFDGAATEAARAPGGDEGADLFAQADVGGSPFGGVDDDVVASAASPRVSKDDAMTGQRNENSVLFSLSNLQALATGGGGGAPAPAPMGGGGGGPAPGHASGEGSGLIDIRALASATSTGGSSSSSASSGASDLLSIGGGGGLGSSLGAPVLAPAAPEPEKNNKGMIIGIGVAAVMVVGLLIALVVVLTQQPEPVAQASTGPATETTPDIAPAVDPTTMEMPAAGAPITSEMAAEPESTMETETEDDEDDRGSMRRPGSSRGMRGSSNDSPASAMSDPDPTPPTRMASGSIDDLLNAALGDMSSMSSAMTESAMASSNLPPQPSRDDVGRALRGVSDRVGSCGNGTSGVANAAITFADSGRVRSVRVTGVPPAVQSCVARTVRSARVPPFSRPTFNVNFPFRVR